MCEYHRLFRLCGRLSLRQLFGNTCSQVRQRSLPLMRKTFIEAPCFLLVWWRTKQSLPLMRKTFIEARSVTITPQQRFESLPLMRKTFIEAFHGGRVACLRARSLPLMRKTFIEARRRCCNCRWLSCLFCLCGRLSLRLGGGKHPAPARLGLFCLCGRLSLRWGTFARVRRILLFPPLLWRLSLRAG